MLRHESFCWLAALALFGSPVLPKLAAQDLSATNVVAHQDTAPPPTLTATIRSEERSGAEHVQRAYFSLGTNRFAFFVPSGFRLDVSNRRRIVLVKEDYTCFLTFRVLSSLSGRSESTHCRQMPEVAA